MESILHSLHRRDCFNHSWKGKESMIPFLNLSKIENSAVKPNEIRAWKRSIKMDINSSSFSSSKALEAVEVVYTMLFSCLLDPCLLEKKIPFNRVCPSDGKSGFSSHALMKLNQVSISLPWIYTVGLHPPGVLNHWHVLELLDGLLVVFVDLRKESMPAQKQLRHWVGFSNEQIANTKHFSHRIKWQWSMNVELQPQQQPKNTLWYTLFCIHGNVFVDFSRSARNSWKSRILLSLQRVSTRM